MAGLTLDTGALIAFERRDRSIAIFLKEALLTGSRITIPTVVLAEGFRGKNERRLSELFNMAVLEPLDEGLAKMAGRALASVRGATPIDSIVMASAARRHDCVLTSDPLDLLRLRDAFPSVRVARL